MGHQLYDPAIVLKRRGGRAVTVVGSRESARLVVVLLAHGLALRVRGLSRPLTIGRVDQHVKSILSTYLIGLGYGTGRDGPIETVPRL